MCSNCYSCDVGTICENLNVRKDEGDIDAPCDGSSRFKEKKVKYQCQYCSYTTEPELIVIGKKYCCKCHTLKPMIPLEDISYWQDYALAKKGGKKKDG